MSFPHLARVPLTVAAVAGLCLPLTAQTFEPVSSIAWPDGLGNGPVSRTEVGDLDGDLLLDVVALAGDVPLWSYGPGAYVHVEDLPATALDIAIAPGQGADGADALVFTGAGGLRQAVFQPSETGRFAISPLGDAAWAGARRVLVDASDPTTLYGLDATGGTLLVLEDAFGAGATDTVDIADDTLDIVALDWVAGGPDEIAVMAATSVRVVSRAGAVLFDMPLAVDKAVGTRFRQDGTAGERLAAVVRLSGVPDEFLHVLDATVIEAPIALGPAEVHGIASGDLDADGDDDLVVAHRFPATPPEQTLFVCHNLSDGAAAGTSPTFMMGAGGSEAVPLGTASNPSPSQRAWPVVGDFSRDGDLDVAVSVNARAVLGFLEGAAVDDDDHALAVDQADGTWLSDADSVQLTLDLGAPALQVEGATHLQVTSWHAQLSSQGAPAALPLPPDTELELLEATSVVFWPLAGSVDDPQSILLDAFDGVDLRALELALARVGPSQVVEAVGPMSQLVLGVDEYDGKGQLALVSSFLPPGTLLPFDLFLVDSSDAGGADVPGGVGPLPDPPGFGGSDGGGGGPTKPPPEFDG